MKRAVAVLAIALQAPLGVTRARTRRAAPCRSDPPPAHHRNGPCPTTPDAARAPPTPAEVALWVPRVVLSPALPRERVRHPLAARRSRSRRPSAPTSRGRSTTSSPSGPTTRPGFVPVGFVDFDFNPSVGVYAFWNDAASRATTGSVHVEAWPDRLVRGVVCTDHIRLDERRAVQFHCRGHPAARPRLLRHRARPLQSSQSRYGEDRLRRRARRSTGASGARAACRLALGPAQLRASTTATTASDPSIERRRATGAFALPPGSAPATRPSTTAVLASLDSRRPWPAPGSGAAARGAGRAG